MLSVAKHRYRHNKNQFLLDRKFHECLQGQIVCGVVDVSIGPKRRMPDIVHIAPKPNAAPLRTNQKDVIS